jgi:hypothetical protein
MSVQNRKRQIGGRYERIAKKKNPTCAGLIHDSDEDRRLGRSVKRSAWYSSRVFQKYAFDFPKGR